GLGTPSYSPDGRYIAAMTADAKKLMLFDSSTQNWTELVKVSATYIGYINWSHDGKYIYFLSDRISRVRISDRTTEQVVSLDNIRLGGFGPWVFRLTPDDSPLVVRDIGTQEIYALDVDLP